MRNLLFGVILGLLAVCQSTPVDNVTQKPTGPEEDILREVLEDGYLVDETTPRVLTTNPPRIHTTAQAPRQPTSDPKNIDMEGSAESTAELSTTAVSQERDADVLNATQSGNSTSAEEAGDSSSASATTHSSGSKYLTSSVPPRAPSSPSTPSLTNQTSDIEDASGDLSSGSGDIQSFVTIPRETSSSDTKEPTASSFPVPDEESEPSRESEKESESDKTAHKESDKVSDTESEKASDPTSESDAETESDTRSRSRSSGMSSGSITEKATQQQGHDKVVNGQTATSDGHHRTPGWIIIVAFIVGLAALVMLCVAIATRDKWNGPHKASQLETRSSSSDQQREQEMTTFVHKESPRENGKAAEYTVIPLDELPENYSSH